jgi:bacteriocin-like protein
MKELNLNEMKSVNGGRFIGLFEGVFPLPGDKYKILP